MTIKHNSLKVEHLHFLKHGVTFIEDNEKSLLEAGAEIPFERLQAILDDDFSWAYLYELPVKHNAILLLSAFGLLDVIVQSINSNTSATQAIINQVVKCLKDPDAFVNGVFNTETEPSTIEELKSLRMGPNGVDARLKLTTCAR